MSRKHKECWEEINGRELEEEQKIKGILSNIVPRSRTVSNHIAVAGGAALRWYQREMSVGPYWEDRHADVDVFVTGDYGRSETFFPFVNKCIDTLLRNDEVIEAIEQTWNNYVYPGIQVAIVNIKIQGVDRTLSFIQGMFDQNIREVVDRFDINICKVIYYIHEQRFELSKEVSRCIESGRGLVCLKTYERDSIGQRLYQIKLKRTNERMRKYRNRGFNLEWK